MRIVITFMLGIAVGLWVAFFTFGRRLPPDDLMWALICALVLSVVILLSSVVLLILELDTNDRVR